MAEIPEKRTEKENSVETGIDEPLVIEEKGQEELSEEQIKEMVLEFLHEIGNKLIYIQTYPEIAMRNPNDPSVTLLKEIAIDDLRLALTWISNFRTHIEQHAEFGNYLSVEQLDTLQTLISSNLSNIESDRFLSSDSDEAQIAAADAQNLRKQYDQIKNSAKEKMIITKNWEQIEELEAQSAEAETQELE